MDIKKDIDLAKANNEQYKKAFQKLKKKNNKVVDEMFHSLHEEVFDKVDCLSCANCCKTISPIFRDVDIKRISKKLRLKEAELIKNYLRLDDESDYVLKSSPCYFLDSDNKCLIYEDRPLACREYPHTDRKNMRQILNLTLKNTEVCPAVAQITEQITSNLKK